MDRLQWNCGKLISPIVLDLLQFRSKTEKSEKLKKEKSSIVGPQFWPITQDKGAKVLIKWFQLQPLLMKADCIS